MNAELRIPGNPDNKPNLPKPVFSIRLHHLTSDDGKVVDALTRRKTPQQLRIEKRKSIDTMWHGEDPSYVADVLGNNSSGREAFLDGVEAFYTQLSNLKDEDVVRLDIAPDGICRSCVKGGHCTATNYTSDEGDRLSYTDTDIEEVDALRIKSLLVTQGYRRGRDYWIQRMLYDFVDLSWQPLDDSTAGRAVKIPFDSILVKARVLRKLKYPTKPAIGN